MRGRDRTAASVMALVLGAGMAAAQMPAPGQPQSAPMGGMGQTGCTGMMGGMGKSGPSGSMAGMDMGSVKAKPAVPAGPLKIAFGDKAAEWTPATLAALPHKSLTVCNQHVGVNQIYSGVPLIDLLTLLGVPGKPHGKDFRLYLVAEGSDGYQVVYSVAEITPDVHDGAVIVADALEGKPLTDSGPLQLVATGEKRPARWVRNLVAIRVLTAQ